MSYKDKVPTLGVLQSLLHGVNVRQALLICGLNLVCFALALSWFGSAAPSVHPVSGAAAVDSSGALVSQAAHANVAAVAPLVCPPPPPPPPPAAAASLPRNAIVGLASNVAYNFLYHFVRSGREVCPLCTILLYMPKKDVTEQVAAMLRYFRVDVVEYDALLSALPAKHRGFHPSSYRWLLMNDHLASLSAEQRYDALFMTDVRDTVFLRDPFSAIITEGDGLYVAMEAAAVAIAQEGWNSGWIRDCFGDAMVQRVGREVVSCSGTSLGTWAASLAYLRLISDLIREHEACERNGIDQGVHNVIVHTGLMKPHAVHRLSNERGLIATVQSMPALRRNEWGYVVNDAGDTVAVVHQVDRSKLLLAQYDLQYPVIPEHQRTGK